MIIPEYKTIFVHIPRTGGTSLEILFCGKDTGFSSKEDFLSYAKERLLRGENKHHTGDISTLMGKYIKLEVGEEIFNSYYKFSFVRNPWDKLVSAYSFARKKLEITSAPDRIIPSKKILDLEECHSFEKFLQTIQEKKYIHWEEQHKFLYDDDGNLLVDDIFRFEDLENEVDRVLDKIGFSGDRDLVHEARSYHPPYGCYYTNETRELVAEMYAKDIELFGYTF